MGYIKKLKNNELVGGTDKTTIYPVTSTEAVFEEITNGNESSFKSQKTINKEQQDELDDHEDRIQAAEAEDIKSITINGSTKEFRVDDNNNVDLTIYTVDSDPDMPDIADNVRDLRNMVGTSTPVLETSHKTRIETLEGNDAVTGSVENKIKTKVDSINSSYQDDNNKYVKYSMTQTSGKVTNFNIDETSLKNAITSLNTSISGDNIVIRSGSTPSGTGEAGKIYRYVNSSNNTYTDYMYSGGSWITLAIHDTSDEQAQVAYYTCTAIGSGAQAIKQFVSNGSLEYTPSSGGHIKILMGEANTATGTIYLQYNTDATNTKKPLYYNGEPVSLDNTWDAGETIAVYYDPSANSNAGAYFASNAQGGGGKAEKIKYDNSASRLAAQNVQGALDEVKRVSIGSKALTLQEYTGTTALGLVSQRQINADGTITAATGSSRNNYLVRWFKGICSKDDYIEFEGTPNSGRTVRIGFVEDNPDEMTDEELLATVVDDVSELYIAANTTGRIRVKAPYDGYLIYFLVAGSGVWQGPTWTIYRSNIVYDVKNNLEETVPGNPLDAVQGALLYSKIEKTTQFVNTGYYAIANKGIDTTNTIVSVSSAFNIGYIPVKKNQIFKLHYTQSDALNCVLQVAMTSEVPAVNVVVTDLITDQKEEGLVTYTVPYDGYLVFRYRLDSGYMTLFEVLKESVLTEYEDYYEDTNVVHSYTGKIISVDESNLGAEVSVDSSWGWGSSTYLYVKGCKYVKIRLFASGRGSLMNKGGVFYDADKQPLSVGAVGTIVPHSPGITGHDVDSIIEVPADAVYFRFTTWTADTVENAVKISTYKYKANSSFDSRKEAIDYILAQAKYVDAVNSTAGVDRVNEKSLTILHYTDIHAETRAAEFIKEVIDALGDKLDDVLCTGDVVYANYKSSSTEDSSAISDAAPYGYVWWQNSGLAEKSLFTIGNHEGNQRSSTSQYHETSPNNDWDYIGKQVGCETFIEPYAEGLGITRPDGVDDPESPNYKAMYWYKDYPEQKIRLIGIDGIHHYDNVRYTTREQEDWLEDVLAETLDSTKTAYGYSVLFACHFGLDDYTGDNAQWDEESHKWVCNENAGGGRIMRNGENVTKFHDIMSTSYTCNAQMALRVKYIPSGGTYGQRKNTDENPIGDIIQDWIDGGGKCVAWIAGHTHMDYMFYPTKYPSILNIVNTCARSGFETNMSYSPVDIKTGTYEDYCANIYVFDTQNGFVKIIRVGRSMDKYLVKKDYLCYDYVNKKVISEG